MATREPTPKPEPADRRNGPGRLATRLTVLCLAACVLAGCTNGRLFTSKTLPYTKNFNVTPCSWYQDAGETDGESSPDAARSAPLPEEGEMATGRGRIIRLTYDLYDVRWSSNAIGDIAREHGLSTVCFADIETTSILGIWNRYRIHVYGY